MFQVPILIILYNRVEAMHNLFQVLRELKPSRLYIAADGAVHGERMDYASCLKTRNVIMPHWDCQVERLFKDEHLGKAALTMQAMNWFFEHEEEGIILFEDTLPHYDFFSYCQNLLEKYRSNTDIVHIGGGNVQKRLHRKIPSYYFSAYATFWGFATWKNRWQNFDLKMTELKDADIPTMLKQYFHRKKELKYWTKWYKNKKIDLLEYQYNFHVWFRGGLCIAPSSNLIANMAFQRNKKRKIRKLLKKTYPIMPLIQPEEIKRDIKADRYILKKYYKRDLIAMFADWITINLLGMHK